MGKLKALEFFSSKCINCKDYAGVEVEKMCKREKPCISDREIKGIQRDLRVVRGAK